MQNSGQVANLGDQWVTAETACSWERLLIDAANNFHRDNALLPGIPHATLKAVLPTKVAPKTFEQLLDKMVKDEHLEKRQEWVVRPGFVPSPTDDQKRWLDALQKVYREAGVQAKGRVDMLDAARTPADQAERLLTYLFANNILVRLNDDSYLHADTFDMALQVLKQHFAKQETLTLAEFRDKINSGRKLTQAILEHFDGLKFTMRKGDARVAWQMPKGSND